MHAPTWIFWANLTPFSLKRDGHVLTVPGEYKAGAEIFLEPRSSRYLDPALHRQRWCWRGVDADGWGHLHNSRGDLMNPLVVSVCASKKTKTAVNLQKIDDLEVDLGLGRIVALCYRSPVLYKIH